MPEGYDTFVRAVGGLMFGLALGETVGMLIARMFFRDYNQAAMLRHTIYGILYATFGILCFVMTIYHTLST